jgi:hypothetical protein
VVSPSLTSASGVNSQDLPIGANDNDFFTRAGSVKQFGKVFLGVMQLVSSHRYSVHAVNRRTKWMINEITAITNKR